MKPPNELPYELHANGCGAFITFDVGERVALPLMALIKATLRGCDAQELTLEFPGTQVIVEGGGLAEPLEHMLGGRVKRIARGCYGDCCVTGIRVVDVG